MLKTQDTTEEVMIEREEEMRRVRMTVAMGVTVFKIVNGLIDAILTLKHLLKFGLQVWTEKRVKKRLRLNLKNSEQL